MAVTAPWLLLAAALVFPVASHAGQAPAAASVTGAAAAVPQPPAGAPAAVVPADTPPPFDRAQSLAALRKQIEGKEDLPATEVFMNIQQYKGVTAGRLLRLMEFGFTRALGVECTHCHVAGEWDRDDKSPKQIARAMSQMTAAINGEYLKKIPDLNSANPSVNCSTCHRGQKRPSLELPTAPATRP